MYQDEQPQRYVIEAFGGYNQGTDLSLLEPGQTQNAQNFVVRNKILEVTPGNTKYVSPAVTGGVKTLMAFYKNLTDGTVQKTLLAASDTNIYRWSGSAWTSIKSGLKSGRFDFINYQMGLTDIIIMSNGVDPMFKWDGTTFANLGGTPPLATSIALHYERIWATGDKAHPNEVRFSKDYDPEYWEIADPNGDDPYADAGGSIELPTWDGGVNIGISTIFDDVVIFKTYTIFKIIGTYPGEYEKVRVHSFGGAIAERSIVDAGTICLFLAIDGVYVYDGVKAYPISHPIKNIIASMNVAYRDKAVGVFYDNRYILAIPEGASTENNAIIEYDTISQTFMIKRGFNVNDFLVFQDKLLFSNNNGFVLEYEKGDTFDGTPIVAFWETPATNLGTLNKLMRSTYFYADTEFMYGSSLKVTSNFDGALKEITITPTSRKKGIRFRNKGRKFYLRIENVSGSRFRLRQPELHLDIDED